MKKAEGVPLFVEEVTKTLLDLGVLRRENGGYRMAKGMDEVSVPDTIQGIIMARLDRLGEEGKRTVQLAETIQTPREIWMGKASLGKVLARMGKDKEAEAQLLQAAQTIEAIAQKLKTPNLHQSFLRAEPVLEVYRALGRRPPQAIP